MDLADVLDMLDAHLGHKSWVDKVAEAEDSHLSMMEDNLMDMWLEAMKHTGVDGNVVLSPVVIKLITALLQKVTTALKDSHQAHLSVDCLEAKLAELAAKPHSLPVRPTTWANVTKQAPIAATPLPQCAPSPLMQTINEFKASVRAELL
ncbi:hypothetical protein CROQUDRAFT_89270 [Cronartium quercuum f. sp. fusiforme G11]|uniref:Uncharacterized protein n=1 Tax=Cronartium quercuum f. sp. fusiforme G11 TaxID=708437 RepID=A0A9P6NP14_9BASI|nr:hypothetical protein CROQUDRAFT_89270 [Cronartium quercuum f. sp. fusiforme G11]